MECSGTRIMVRNTKYKKKKKAISIITNHFMKPLIYLRIVNNFICNMNSLIWKMRPEEEEEEEEEEGNDLYWKKQQQHKT